MPLDKAMPEGMPPQAEDENLAAEEDLFADMEEGESPGEELPPELEEAKTKFEELGWTLTPPAANEGEDFAEEEEEGEEMSEEDALFA